MNRAETRFPPRICRWVEQYPLATAQRAIHASFPETRRWSFHPCELSEPDSSLVRFFTWNLPKEDKYQSLTTVAVMVQCPWVISNADLVTFARCRLVSGLQLDQTVTRYPLLLASPRPQRRGKGAVPQPRKNVGEGIYVHVNIVCPVLTAHGYLGRCGTSALGESVIISSSPTILHGHLAHSRPVSFR